MSILVYQLMLPTKGFPEPVSPQTWVGTAFLAKPSIATLHLNPLLEVMAIPFGLIVVSPPVCVW